MQLIITTDKGLALQQHCGGNVSLDNEPTGHFNLTLPGLFTDDNNTDTLDSMNQRSDKTLSVCTWTIGVPQGLTVLLKLDTGLRVSVRCVLNEEDEVLESGGTTLLARCHGNEATFTWTGPGRSPDHIQLSYSVQEDERNSSADHTSPRSGLDLLDSTQTGTSSASDSPEGRDFVRGTEGVRGHLYEGLESRSEARSTSGPSSQDQDLLHPTSPLQGASAAGRADRETLPLPEEGPNNGADTSGAARRADATETTRPSFQPSLGTDAPFHTSHAAKTSSDPRTRMTRAAASSSDAYTHTYTATRVSELSASTPAPPGSSVPPLTSSPTPWESGTALIPPSGGVSGASGEKGPGSWRTQRSTDRLYSDPVSAVTSDPLKPPTEAQQEVSTDTGPTASSSSSSSQGPTLHITGLNTAAGSDPNPGRTDSSVPTVSDVTSHAAAFESSDGLSLASSTASGQTNPPENTEMPPHPSSPSTRTSKAETQTSTPGLTKEDHRTSSSSPTEAVTLGDVVQTSAPPGTTTVSETYTPGPVYTPLKEDSSTNTATPVPPLSFTPSNTLQTHTALPASPTSNPLSSPSAATEQHTAPPNHETPTVPSQTITSTFTHTPHTQNPPPSPSTTEEPRSYITTTPLLSRTTAGDEHGGGGVEDVEKRFPSSTMRQTPTAGALSWTTSWTTLSPPGQENHMTLTPSASASSWSSETSQTPKFYIVPDRPVCVTVESIELLLQIVVEESRSAFTPGLEEDTTAWVEPYLRKAPGFSRLLGVWSSGHAVQSLVQFKTSGALQWLGRTGATSLLDRTGLAQAVCDGRSFRSSKITNITLGGLQADVCDWLLQCPAGYECVFQPGTSNYSCSSVCHFDYCHHHGICTHHPGGQLPVCRCLVGEDFWYMGRRCDVRMTRARLVGACLAVLLVIVTVIGILALVAVRRYRAILIQAKVDQTRSSYRRFNHFDELSGRFWLRSWAGSADSLDNPAFTRSDELLHLRALDRPCCYHDDTLSLASTCPSHGTRINTIYPHSSQYGWRGSEMSMGEGVLDSGKASDLSVCSWPVEPIQWTPFPLLQQLASQRTPTQVRVSRPRSYCEGMELVDLGKSWTA